MVILQGKGEQMLDSKDLKVYTKHEQVCVERKAIKWSMITQIIEGRMVFLIMNSIGILEGVKMLMMITTNFVERLHEDAIARR